MDSYSASLNYLARFMTIDTTIEKAIKKHCTKYNIRPYICAWYSDVEDFFSDWCHLGYTRTEARKILHGGIGEFQTFKNGNIIRYVL